MAVIDVSIVPLGTATTSVSSYVADIHKVLAAYEGRVKYMLTPMNTIIEGDLPLLFEVVQRMQEVPFEKGAARVATTIRIDDRRDKKSTMEQKLASVKEKME